MSKPRPVRLRAAARATALLDAAYAASADGDGPTWVRTSRVRYDEHRSAYVVATNDAVTWDEGLRGFVVPPDTADALVFLGADPLGAIESARRIYRQATRNERAAQRATDHERAMDVLSVLFPFLGNVLNAAVKLR